MACSVWHLVRGLVFYGRVSVGLTINLALAECKVAEVERDQQRLGHLLHRFVVSVYSTRSRHLDALKVPVIRGVVRAGGTTQNIDRVVMSPHQAVRPEMRDLGLVVASNVRRKGDLQAAPHLAVLVPRRDLLALKTWIGVEEGQGKIGPQRLACEISDVEFVPWRFDRLARIRCLGIVTTLDNGSVKRF